MSIDTGSLVLAVPAGNGSHENQDEHPQLGAKVRLELSLPVPERPRRARYLALRAHVAAVTEMHDGSRQIKFTFRKASFKDRVQDALPKVSKTASKLWRM